MTPEQQRIAIAEACGWRKVRQTKEFNSKTCHMDHLMRPIRHMWSPKQPDPSNYYVLGWTENDQPEVFNIRWLPDYLADLNAMHEAEKECINTIPLGEKYVTALDEVCALSNGVWAVFASAKQRAEAFLRAIGKWTSD